MLNISTLIQSTCPQVSELRKTSRLERAIISWTILYFRRFNPCKGHIPCTHWACTNKLHDWKNFAGKTGFCVCVSLTVLPLCSQSASGIKHSHRIPDYRIIKPCVSDFLFVLRWSEIVKKWTMQHAATQVQLPRALKIWIVQGFLWLQYDLMFLLDYRI